jgi:hypothetical protein
MAEPHCRRQRATHAEVEAVAPPSIDPERTRHEAEARREVAVELGEPGLRVDEHGWRSCAPRHRARRVWARSRGHDSTALRA